MAKVCAIGSVRVLVLDNIAHTSGDFSKIDGRVGVRILPVAHLGEAKPRNATEKPNSLARHEIGIAQSLLTVTASSRMSVPCAVAGCAESAAWSPAHEGHLIGVLPINLHSPAVKL